MTQSPPQVTCFSCACVLDSIPHFANLQSHSCQMHSVLKTEHHSVFRPASHGQGPGGSPSTFLLATAANFKSNSESRAHYLLAFWDKGKDLPSDKRIISLIICQEFNWLFSIVFQLMQCTVWLISFAKMGSRARNENNCCQRQIHPLLQLCKLGIANIGKPSRNASEQKRSSLWTLWVHDWLSKKQIKHLASKV